MRHDIGRRFGVPGASLATVNRPHGLATEAQSRVYVSDRRNHALGADGTLVVREESNERLSRTFVR